MCICRASAAVVCCVNSLNTDGAACLHTWQVHSPGSSPCSYVPPSRSLFLSAPVCQCLSLSVLLSVFCTCCTRLYWSALLSVSESVCLCLCMSLSVCVCAVSDDDRQSCCRGVIPVYYDLDHTFGDLATISTCYDNAVPK